MAAFAIPEPAWAATPIVRGVRVAAVARHQVGHWYGWGAAGPTSFDCSGLVQFSFRHATGRHLPHNAAALSGMGRPISRRQARAGDVMYWGQRGSAFHVALVVGRGRRGRLLIVEATTSGQPVRLGPPTWGRPHVVRIIRNRRPNR